MDKGAFICVAIVWIIVAAAGPQYLGDYGYLVKLGMLPLLVAAGVARLKDAGQNVWASAFLLVPGLNLFAVIYLMFVPSKSAGPIGPALEAQIAEASGA